MTSPPPREESDEHGSVITYDEEQQHHQPVITTPIKTQSQKTKSRASLNSKDNDHHSLSATGVQDEQQSKASKMNIHSFRARLGDICDSRSWESTYVLLTVIFVILVIAEVSILSSPFFVTAVNLQGMSVTLTVILAFFFFEVIIKSIAFDMGFWRVSRNSIEAGIIIVAFALQIAYTTQVYVNVSGFSTAQLMVSSRVFSLLVCITRQKRIRELYTATRTLRIHGNENLTTAERTLKILHEIKAKYPLNDVDQLQLQWCINVIASHRLYTGFFYGPNGERIMFHGVDEDTSEWLIGTYSRTKPENATTTSAAANKMETPPKENEPLRSSSPIGFATKQAQLRRDSDPDSLLTGRRHTPLYLTHEVDTVGSNSPQTYSPDVGRDISHKRTLSKASLSRTDSFKPKSSGLRRGSSFANHTAEIVDLEEGLSFGGQSTSPTRVITGASIGITIQDLEYFEEKTKDDDDEPCTYNRNPEFLDKTNREFDEWNFDIFTFNDVMQTRPLSSAIIIALRKNNIFDALSNCISLPTVLNFCIEVENGYLTTNAYHNRMHAADVVQCFHHFLTHRQLRDSTTPLDRLAGLIAAAIHDFRHPGVNNAFLIATRHDYAIQYNDLAVLENMHVSEAFKLMKDNPDLDIFSGLPVTARTEARDTMIQMVLATDMKAHFDVLNHFRTQVVQVQTVEKTHENLGAWFHELFPIDKDSSFNSAASAAPPMMAYPLEYRRTILKTALHVADVSNPARPKDITIRWADLVQQEFFCQGDLERDLSLPVSMFMDRQKPAFPKMQVGFIEFIVKPLLEAYGSWLKSLKPTFDIHLTENLDYWKKRQEAESSGQISAVPAVPLPEPMKVTNRLVARLKRTTSKHRTTASHDFTLTESPTKVKKPVSIRRSNSEQYSSPQQEEPRRRDPSPLLTKNGQTVATASSTNNDE